jgi:hypothetical protein
MNQCPPGPQVFHWSLFDFFQKFSEVFANECLLPVSTTPAKNLSPVSLTPVNNLYFPVVADTIQKKTKKPKIYRLCQRHRQKIVHRCVSNTDDKFFGGVSDTGD